nr:DNA polymerase III subunit gamma and tau [Planctomonas sp. JC2975]
MYRRYRPETFAEMIGQSQVTEPLMTALRTNRVNHAYLFSGPRGCGKTTSARILARCLNCAEGPTDTPCGKCESCIELGRGGQGSLDVVEIDAASHNGVDDARDIRERAIFAPARDRYKIFILDEAHMVTPQGFNALLKIVEEPPEHVKFIFATTEPDKVIGTIRSRTHHYPFRLVPPAQMLDYVQQLCESEHMSVAPGVLPLVVRAGGGSPRDTLSLLDQLIAGSEGDTIEYERAVALLGYTHAALLDEVVDAVGAQDAASAFAAVDRVIQTGQDPRRFVEDLLERLRDLIIVAATSPDAAAAVLRGTPQEELDRMSVQARAFGSAELSRCADIVNAALTEMTGATSPRLHLELMLARTLVPASDATERGALARVERLERRVGVEGSTAGGASSSAGTSTPPAAQPQRAASATAPVGPSGQGAAPAATAPGAAQERATQRPAASPAPAREPAPAAANHAESAAAAWSAHAPSTSPAPGQSGSTGSRADERAESPSAASTSSADTSSPSRPNPSSAATTSPPAAPATDPAVAQAAAFAAAAAAKKGTAPVSGGSASGWATPGVTDDAAAPVVAPVTTQQVRDAWPEILEAVEEASRTAWTVVYTATVRSLDGDVLSLSFPSANDVDSFRGTPGATDAASEVLRNAIVDLLGVKVKFVAKPAGSDGGAGGLGHGGPAQGGPAQGGPAQGGSAQGGSAQSGQATSPSAAQNRPEGAGPTSGGPAQGGRAGGGGGQGAPGSDAGTRDPQAPSRQPQQASAPSDGPAAGVSRPSPSRQGAARPSVASATSAGWETVAIPGAATAVLERPQESASDTRPSEVEHSAGASASATDPAARTASASSTEDGLDPRPAVAPSTDTDDEGWYVGPDAPDDEEPPFPDDGGAGGAAVGSDDGGTKADLRTEAAAADTVPSTPAKTIPTPTSANPAGQSAPVSAPASGGAASSTPSGEVDAGSAATASSSRNDRASSRNDQGASRAKASVGFREPARYGEAVVRELLGAKFIEEQEVSQPGQSGSSGWSR